MESNEALSPKASRNDWREAIMLPRGLVAHNYIMPFPPVLSLSTFSFSSRVLAGLHGAKLFLKSRVIT